MQPQTGPLSLGDRVANFALPDTAGLQRVFYLERGGGPVLLFACGGTSDPAQAAALAALAAAADGLRSRGVELLAVTGDGVAANKATAERLGLDLALFSDPQGAVLAHLLAPEPPASPDRESARPAFASYALDPNQRVLGRFVQPRAEAQLEAAAAAFDAWSGRREPPRVLAEAAPVLALPDVFEPALCRALIEAWEREHHEGGLSDGTRNVVDESKKRNLEHVIADPALRRRVVHTLARRIGPELVKVFNYRAPFRFEGLYVLSYRHDRQDFFGTHRDNLRQESPRRFALSLNLNDEFEGGELRFPEYGPHLYKPGAGAAVVFSCDLLHEALPVTRGQRWVLVSFFCDPDQPPQGAQRGRRQVAM